jgi:hypothetical protein
MMSNDIEAFQLRQMVRFVNHLKDGRPECGEINFLMATGVCYADFAGVRLTNEEMHRVIEMMDKATAFASEEGGRN